MGKVNPTFTLMEYLTSQIVYKILKKSFPTQNDYSYCDYKEELEELRKFGIHTSEALELLISTHREQILKIDSEPLDTQHIKWYREDNSILNLEDKIQKGYWFALPGLLRVGLELEFGQKYRDFANNRDGIT